MLDQSFNPWVLEVNLSPACREREQFLTKMLDDMAFDLVSWLERKILVSSISEAEVTSLPDTLRAKRAQILKQKEEHTTNLNPEQFYIDNNIKNRWCRLSESIEELQSFGTTQLQNLNQTPVLEIVGTKADLKYEKRLDLNHKKI